LLRLPGTPSVEHLPLTDPTKLRFGRLVAMSRALRVLAGLAAPLGAVATGSQAMATSSSRANPIRRVVSMLQMMQEKVTAEGKAEEELFNKFMCYCKTGEGDLRASISDAEAKIEADKSSLEAAIALKAQLEKDLGGAKGSREEAEEAVAEAKALREKEAAAFAKASADLKTNTAALGKAIAALERGAGDAFLQTGTAAKLRQLSIDADISAPDREILTAFLSQGEADGYAPQSGQITGILKQMKETMEKDLAELTATEEAAIKDFEAMMAAKAKETESLGGAIEAKTERLGKVGIEIVELKEEVSDTTKAMEDDKKFLADLAKNCGTKEKEWEVRSAMRAEELLALAETIKILNDDDALELFKKTLPSPTLLQLKVSAKAVRQRAMRALRSAGGAHDPRLGAVLLALAGKSGGFEKVMAMVDEMVTLLGSEQKADDEKKAYCEASIDKAEDEQKVLDQSLADIEKAIADAKETVAKLTEEIVALVKGIKDLDKSVAEATETRKAENAEYKETMASDKAAKELIGIAKNRLNQFYNPKLHKAAPKQELSAEDRVFVNNGGTPPPTAAPGGIAGTGVTALVQISAHDASQEAPPPPPATWDAYQKKGQESNGVISMLDMLAADLDKEVQEMEVEEKEAQADYEGFMEDSKTKRAADSQLIADKEGAKADLEAGLEKDEVERKGLLKRGMEKAEELKDLHLECDWLLSNFEARKEARAGEVDALKKARAVLSGADYSLVQTRAASHRRLRGIRA